MAMHTMTVNGPWTDKPSSKEIFGNFIESGFGRQVSGMWAEMLYNRAFRKVPPYQQATWEWLGLDAAHYHAAAPFWHSGYEENDWELVGAPVASHTCGTHTYKGSTSLMLENRTPGQTCGLRQVGLHLQAGRAYQFRLFAGVRGDLGGAGLNGFGASVQEGKEQTLRVRIGEQETAFALSPVCARFDWQFTAAKTEVADIVLSFDFAGTLLLSCASLMPADNLGGWRRDVVEKLRQVQPSVVRFPGGCFVSFYNWESSIGDPDTREPQPSYYWGGLEENDVGLDEFLHLAGLVGFAPQMCFNMMTSSPFKARQLVEYLNAPQEVGMGRLRMLNGHAAPYGVKLFEMDNEPGRKWTAEQYAKQCVAFAREMRLADPHIQLMLAAYSYDPACLPTLLQIAGKDVDYIIYRQGDPAFASQVLPVLRRYNEANGTKLRLVNTEWLPSCDSIEPFEDPGVPMHFSWHAEISNDYRKIFGVQQQSWNYALNGAHRLLDYISYGGDFALANFNNMCNTWGQNVIEASKDGCALSCMGQVFALFGRTFQPCVAAKVDTGDSRLFALLTKSADGCEQLYVVNHSGSAITARLPQGEWQVQDGLRGERRLVCQPQPYCPQIQNGAVDFAPLSLLALKKRA